MHRARLERLLTIMRNVETQKFDMSTWFKLQDPIFNPLQKEVSCGFTACAGGWAALDPEFNKQGLTIDLADEGQIEFKGRVGLEALADFFELPELIADMLFDPYYYFVENWYAGIFFPKKLFSELEYFTDNMPKIKIGLVIRRLRYTLANAHKLDAFVQDNE